MSDRLASAAVASVGRLDPASPPVILGGTNFIARYLLRRLQAGGRSALVMARRSVDVAAPSEFLGFDADDWSAPPGRTVVSVLPLPVLIGMLPRLARAASIVAIGSTNVLSKAGSLDPHDQAIAARLVDAEAALTAWCQARGVRFTILRPTLVYDGVEDRNVTRMAGFIRRYGFLPIAAPARGLRQPIHADDVAKAILGCLANPAAENRAFNVAGAEILTYRAMAERIFMEVGRRPLFLRLPIRWLETGFRWAVRSGLLHQGGVGISVFRRMNEDQVFDISEGLEVLRYDPRGFELPRRT